MGNKILIVDDEEQFRFALKLTLKRAGYEVKEAENGDQAINMIYEAEKERHDFDLVLLDIEMPVMSGIEFVYELQRNDLDVPVIILSGHADNASFVLELGRHGYTEIMNKQFEPDELLSRIDSILSIRKN